MILFTIFLFLILVWLYKIDAINRIIRFKKIIDFSKTIPGPGFFELYKNAQKENVLPWLRRMTETFGPLFRIWFGKDLIVFVTDPEDVKVVLSSNELLYKSGNYKILEPWLGRGLLTAGGERWFTKRKVLTPAFHFKILGAFKSPMMECGEILINKFNDHVDKGVFDIYPYVTLYALDVICETAMGIKKNAQINSETEYVKSVQKICGILHSRSFSLWRRIRFLAQFASDNKVLLETLKVLHDETNRVIALRRKLLETDDVKEMKIDGDEFLGTKRRLAFLDILLMAQRDGAPLSDADIREEVDTFMFEGHDTTSSAISFSLYLLSQNKQVQDRLYEEVSNYDSTQLESMKYMDSVIKETLRLYPSVPFYSRNLQQDFKIRDKTIPTGASISVLAHAIHRNPTAYSEPDKFKPERWSADEGEDIKNPFSHVAFSAGPRNCIGQKFAMLELKLTLFKLLNAFEFQPAEGFEPILLAELILKSANGVKLKIKRRN